MCRNQYEKLIKISDKSYGFWLISGEIQIKIENLLKIKV